MVDINWRGERLMVREGNEGEVTCDKLQEENERERCKPTVGSGTEEVEDGKRQNVCKDVSFISLW